MILAPQLWIVAVVVLIEGILHAHIDWAKEHVTRRWTKGIAEPRYWYLFGFDQLLHQLTYLGMIFFLLD